MGDLNRRTVLLGAGALGAAGALGLVSPAHAWTWSAQASVAGAGRGVDPRRVWDPEADALVADLFARGQVERVNALLADWTTNGQALPAGLPRDLRAFLDRARVLPAWTDEAALAQAFSFYERRGLYLGLLYGLGSGMMSCAIPREARAVYYSAGGADLKDRIAKTAKLGYDLGAPDAFGPSGQMIVTALKTRLTHAAVRHLLPRSGHWKSGATEHLPISQADILVTWHSLATFSRNKLTAWQVPVTSADEDAFLHLWQVTAHVLGVDDEYIPGTWDSASRQSRQILDPVLAPTSEGVKLAHGLLDLAGAQGGMSRPMLHSFIRYCLGDRITDWLEIPREPGPDQAVAQGWPHFLTFRESLVGAPVPGSVFWAQDEFLRLAVLFFLGDGQRINITMPTGNNPNYR
ncbi:oxygenase MpaB family protein [Sporichthya polymorpha]|uniref:oxygenase MpaB family protein n=1 Tax=Sporichthya polymorpha TaxID=35751 RepID=UPI000369E9F5|nr:oxygenase MpaB family protein [Sporichthya polymorpha]